MNKIIIKFAFVFLIVMVLAPYSIVMANEDNKITEVLIIYDKEIHRESKVNIVKSIKTLLYGFNARGHALDSRDYTKGKIHRYNKVIIISMDDELNSNELISDLNRFSGDIFWIGKRIDKLLFNHDIHNIDFKVKNLSLKEISYNNKNLKNNKIHKYKIDFHDEYTMINYGNIDKVYSYVSDGKNRYKSIWNKKNIWNMSLIPYEEKVFYIFCDVLNDFFKIYNREESKVFIKINDVNLNSNLNNLKNLADYLKNENIPFIISYNPDYLDNKKSIKVINNSDVLAKTIKDMQKKGGSIILKGNNYGEYKETLLDFKTKILKCVKNGIYPLAIDEYDDTFDITKYNNINKNFSTYVGGNKGDTEKYKILNMPYELKNLEGYNIVIPENLETVSLGDRYWMNKFKERYNSISLVRGNVKGISFSSSLDLDYLREVIKHIKKENIKFIDLKDYNNWVKYNDIEITSFKGNIDVKYRDSNGDIEEIKDRKYNMEKINNIIFIIFIMFIIILTITISYYEKFNKKKFK